MVIVHQGSVTIQDTQKVSKGSAAVFTPSGKDDETIKFKIGSSETRFIFLAGQPLNEPIAAQGPFVLNEKEELY